MNASLFVAYLATIAVLMLTPGPDMLFCLATGLRSGPRAGVLAAVGAATGEVIHITAAGAGLAALFRSAPAVFEAVRLVGAAYLVFLGIRAIRNRHGSIGGGSGERESRAYWRGLITNLLNPKMALFTLAFLPQFVDPQRSVPLQFVVLGACFVVLEIAIDGTVGALAGRLHGVLRRPRARRNLNVAAGSAFLGLGARVALER